MMQRQDVFKKNISPADQAAIDAALDTLSYPEKSRISAMLFKFFWGVTAGASVLLTFSAMVATTILWTMAGIIPGILYGIKACKEAYNANVKEKNLIQQLNIEIDTALNIFKQPQENEGYPIANQFNFHLIIQQFLQLLKQLQEERYLQTDKSEEIEFLYAYFQELNEILKRLKILLHARMLLQTAEKQQESKKQLEELSQYLAQIENFQNELNAIRGSEENKPPVAINTPFSSSSKPADSKVTTAEQSKIYAQKFGNRALAFFAGASTGATIAAAVLLALNISLTIAFLFTNPIGWSILGGIIIFGLTAVAVDYLVTRHQENKIKKLEENVDNTKHDQFSAAIQINNIKCTNKDIEKRKIVIAHQKKMDAIIQQVKELEGENAHLRQQLNSENCQEIELSKSLTSVSAHKNPLNEFSTVVKDFEEQLSKWQKKYDELKNENQVLHNQLIELNQAREEEQRQMKAQLKKEAEQEIQELKAKHELELSLLRLKNQNELKAVHQRYEVKLEMQAIKINQLESVTQAKTMSKNMGSANRAKDDSVIGRQSFFKAEKVSKIVALDLAQTQNKM